ncbi:hypothetical protein BW686_14365 [Pseudomonas syringae]|uniref:Uncharacterized protein n=1 Tax=Pseudomonas syringae TaxID=317 RepID=A0A244ERQ6_PSESX|nr:hypothetical protein BW686_14365 [Pseudomonas syringae]
MDTSITQTHRGLVTAYSDSGSRCSSDRLGLRQMRTVSGQTDITQKPHTPAFSTACACQSPDDLKSATNRSCVLSACGLKTLVV